MTIRPIALLLSLISSGAMLSGCAVPVATPPVQDAADPIDNPHPLEDESYHFPMAGGSIPVDHTLLPNARRAYRAGVHEGVDLFTRSDGSAIICGEPVLNSRKGWVIRADHDWQRVSEREYKMITTQLKEKPDDDLLDRLRGLQVWVRSDDGVVIRYCHLRDIVPIIRVGVNVAPGIQLGTVGNTGTSDGSRGTGRNCHLHFEIWPTTDSYLGKGASPKRARRAYADLFKR